MSGRLGSRRSEAVREPTAGDALVDRLRAEITDGKRPLGSRLSDKQIALEAGVSRTPVREALLQLENEGLVVIKPQSGTFVFDLTDVELRQICDARAVLESGALRLLHADPSDEALAELDRLIEASAAAQDAGDSRAFDHLDCLFHETLIAATGNAYLKRSYLAIASQLRALRQRMPRSAERRARALRQHREIVRLARSGQLDRAIDEVEQHVQNVAQLLTKIS